MRPVFHGKAGKHWMKTVLPVMCLVTSGVFFPILPCASCGDAQENESQQTA